ncbi:MAG: hypothetical protein OXC09_06535 [Truepera sp.]|nr:hypothetical protein [Truepera sp.]
MAARRRLHLRMTVCSAGALLSSAVAWLAGLSLLAHALLTTAGFAAGFLYPLRRLPEWALGWLSNRIGLSYETALELERRDDPYGLAEAVVDRTTRLVRNLSPPRNPAWWLPILALALGLLLLPAISLGRLGGSLLPGLSTTGPTDELGSAAERPEDPQLLGEEGVNTGFDENDPPRGEESDPGRGAEGDGSAEGGEGISDAMSDEEALSQFLENLRRRDRPAEPPEENQPDLQRRPAQGSPEETREQGEGDQAGEQGPEEERRGEGSEAGENSGEQQGDSEAANPEGLNGDSQQQGAQEGAAPQQPAGAEFGEGQEPLGDEGGEGAQGGESNEGGASEGGGDGASLERPSTGLDRGEAGEQDFLEGILGPGLENRAGTIQLPGSDAVDLPGGRSAGDYARAVERAITEGSIPVDYQEIIRNYFR